MILLSDNDVIGKLASCDLLDSALEVLKATRKEVYVLGTARYVLGVSSKPKKKLRFDTDTLVRIRAFLDSVQTLPEGQGAELAALNEVPAIDPGEAILYAAASRFEDFRLATDDRNSLRALAGSGLGQVIAKLNGKVITFLPLIGRLIDHLGFEDVRARVVPARQCDTSLRALFGSGMEATEANVREGLASDLRQLRALVGGLLVPDEPDEPSEPAD